MRTYLPFLMIIGSVAQVIAQPVAQLITPTPTASNLIDASFISDERGWVSGSYHILRTSDGGINWDVLNTSPMNSTICFVNSYDGFAYGGQYGFYGKKLYKTFDGGDHWQEIINPTTLPIADFTFTDSVHGFLINGTDTLFSTMDGGTSWNFQIVQPITSALKRMSFPNADTGYISSYTGSIFKTTDGGTTWNSVYTGMEQLEDIFFVDGEHGYCEDIYYSLLRTVDGGLSWSPVAEIDYNILSIHFLNKEQGGFLETNSYYYYTNDGGDTWNQTDLFSDYGLPLGNFYASSLAGTNTMYAFGDQGFIFKAQDTVSVMKEISYHRFTGWITAVHFFNKDEGVITGWQGIHHSFDGGLTWQTGYDTVNKYTGLSFIDSLNGWAVGVHHTYGGTESLIARTTDGGISWGLVYNNIVGFTELENIYMANADTGIVRDEVGKLYLTTDGGASIQELSFPNSIYVSDVQFLHNNIGFASATKNAFPLHARIYKTIDGGISWSLVFDTINAQGPAEIYFLNDQQGWMKLHSYYAGESFWRTTNGGESWQFLTDTLAGYSDYVFMNDTVGYSLTHKGINKTTDGGTSWLLTIPLQDFGYSNLQLLDENIGWVIGAESLYKISETDFPTDNLSNQNAGIEMEIYPNPASSTLIIDAGEYQLSNRVIIRNSFGEIISEFEGSGRIALDISHWNPGIYFATLFNSQQILNKKLMVIR